MSKSNRHVLTKRPQLIDLNSELINFKLDFIVEASDMTKEFLALVLTQDQLDTVDINKIEMKTAQGKITGSITANNNKYQNYFLVLKKKENDDDNDLNVNVQINIERLETEPQEISENLTLSSEVSNEDDAQNCLPFYKKPWFWVFIVVLILVLGLFIYNYIYLKKPFFASKSVPIEQSTNAQQAVIQDTNSSLYKQISEIVK